MTTGGSGGEQQQPARIRVEPGEPGRERLLELLDSSNERTRAVALNALVEIVPVSEMPAVAGSWLIMMAFRKGWPP